MAMNFFSPSMRAAQSDLTIAISPLGLVELADEEFEVHGPRLNRYALHWAFYLGHHWGYRREAGEPQLTFNWVSAFANYLTDFQFGNSVNFRVPEASQLVAPYIYKKVWEEDNDKQTVLNEIGQLGSVSGDVFVKVAFEEPYVDATKTLHEGRVRILPLNPAHCFPEFHPHDRDRMVRFKQKYRFWTTAPEGTRTVMTYVEVLTDELIQEYVNDQLIAERPNPLGKIPVVHIRNLPVASSPWGLADVTDIISLNREYNEKMVEVSDILNYHVAPVTVLIGAKASSLEKGARKMWAIPNEKAHVMNLEARADLPGALAYIELLKRNMHELTGVPEGALGQMQPASNTSGVALAMMYQPLMRRWHRKAAQYGKGLQQVNELIMRTVALKQPELLVWNPALHGGVPDADQYTFLDPADPMTYRTEVHWPSPLPMDVLAKLNELGVKMSMGLESKVGALRDLGHEQPERKLQEIFEEQLEDTEYEGALEMKRATVIAATAALTGIAPDGAQPPGGDDVSSPQSPVSASPPVGNMADDTIASVANKAFGVKAPDRSTDNE